MAQLVIGTKTQLVNSSTLFPVTFYDANWAASTALLGRYMKIEGFGTFDVNNLHDVIGYRGAAGAVETRRIVLADLAVAATIPVDTIVNVKFSIETYRYRSEAIRIGRPGQERQFQIVLNPTDASSPARVLAKLYNAIYSTLFSEDEKVVNTYDPTVMAGAPYNGVFSGNQAVTLDALDTFLLYPGERFNIKFTTESGRPTPYVTYTEPAPLVSGFVGRNNWDTLKGVFIDGETRMPYSVDRVSIPINGILYSSLQWGYRSDRNKEGFGGGIVVSQTDIYSDDKFELFINESACLPMQNNIVDFINRGTVLSTANPTRYAAPIWYSNAVTPTTITAAAFKV